MKDYLLRLKDLNYPEYSGNGYGHDHMDLKLLDLSLSDSDTLSTRLEETIRENIREVSQYRTTQNTELIGRIAQTEKVSQDQILITSGCDGALRIVSQAFINRETNVYIPIPSFGRYEYYSKLNNGITNYIRSNRFPYNYDYKKILATSKLTNENLVYISNPSNPTGVYYSQSDLEKFIKEFSGYVVLDEALLHPGVKSLVPLISDNPKIIVVRSFSKFYGLAGARIGYVIASKEITQLLRKLISPFEVSSLSIFIALELLKDKRYKNGSLKSMRISHDILSEIKNSKVLVSPTVSSTALIKYTGSINLYQYLMDRKIKTVDGQYFRGLENLNTVRISLKNNQALEVLVNILNRMN